MDARPKSCISGSAFTACPAARLEAVASLEAPRRQPPSGAAPPNGLRARDPPWQAVRRDDQPAHLRAAVDEERVLEVDRWPELPARHFHPLRSLRARLVLCRQGSPEGGPPLHQGHARSILCLP